MKAAHIRLFGAILVILLLSGCLYPDNELKKNQVPNADQLESVQKAVDKYKENTNGLVPIKTKPLDTPVFQKYLVDFNALFDKRLLSEPPGNAYENGGLYQYVLLDPENNPRVKLIDLRISETIRSTNVRLDIYRSKNMYPPFGEQIEKGVYKLNYKALGLESPPYVTSPFSRKNLPIIMDANGNLYVDYRIDLYDALEKYEHDYKEGDDIRFLLADNTPFVPVYSLATTIENGEPVYME